MRRLLVLLTVLIICTSSASAWFRHGAVSIDVLMLSATTVDDNAAAGTAIGSFTVPDNYSVVMNYDAGGHFALNGNTLITTAVPLQPGTYQPIVGAFRTGIQGNLRPYPAYENHSTITINAVRTPNDFGNLYGAWRPEDAVLSGSDITSIPNWGAGGSGSITGVGGGVTKPQYVTGIHTKPLIQTGLTTSGERKRFSLPSTITSPDISGMFVVSPPDTNQYQTLVTNTAITSFVALKGIGTGNPLTILGVRGLGMGAVTDITLDVTRKVNNGKAISVIVWTFNSSTKVFNVYVNDNTLAGTATLSSWTSWSFDSLLSSSAGQAMGNALVGPTAIWTKELSTVEVRQVMAMATPYRSRDYFFDTAGNDSNLGWTTATAKAAPLTMLNAFYNSPGDRYWLKANQEFNWTAAWVDPTVHGTAENPLILAGYNGRATISPSTKVLANTAAWTSAGGNTWTTAWATSAPPALWMKLGTVDAYVGLDDYQLIKTGTPASNNYEFSWTANVLTIRTNGVLDPNSFEFRIAPNINQVVNTTRQYFDGFDFDVLCAGRIALQWRGIGSHIGRVRIPYPGGDAFNFGQGTPGGFSYDGIAKGGGDAGPIFLSTSTSADGTTTHGTGIVEDWRMVYLLQLSDGLADEYATTRAQYDVKYILNSKGGARLQSGGGSGGVWTIRRAELTRPAVTTDGTNTFDAGFQLNTGATAATIDIDDAYLDGSLGSVRGKAINNQSGTATVGPNVNQTGFSSLN